MQVEGGACSRGDECGPAGNCVPLWSHHKCECGGDGGGVIVAPDCGASFVPFSLTEEQEIHFFPTDKYRRYARKNEFLEGFFSIFPSSRPIFSSVTDIIEIHKGPYLNDVYTEGGRGG